MNPTLRKLSYLWPTREPWFRHQTTMLCRRGHVAVVRNGLRWLWKASDGFVPVASGSKLTRRAALRAAVAAADSLPPYGWPK